MTLLFRGWWMSYSDLISRLFFSFFYPTMSNLPQNSERLNLNWWLKKDMFSSSWICCVRNVTHILSIIDGNAEFTFYLFIRLIKKVFFCWLNCKLFMLTQRYYKWYFNRNVWSWRFFAINNLLYGIHIWKRDEVFLFLKTNFWKTC